MASDIERRLRAKPNDFVLKPNPLAKADVWKHFSLIFEKFVDSNGTSTEDEVCELKYFCACNSCRRVYAYRASNGDNYGTKNLLDHIKQCCDNRSGDQTSLRQFMAQTVKLSTADEQLLKRRQLEYCVDGYHSFRSLEHNGLINLIQTCVNFGAKYGKYNVRDVLAKRNTISREASSVASVVQEKLIAALKEPNSDGTVSLCLDLYTDDYQKKAYLDVHASWISRDFSLTHSALAIRHFGFIAHTAENISDAVTNILNIYGLSLDDTPVTTDHGSNVVAALRNNVRLDCFCHRLHTVLETAWRDTKIQEPDASAYESAVSDLCRYVKQATGIQERLPKSLKHGGDTRPWIAMYRRADAIDCSYDALITVLTERDKLELIANVSRSLNREILSLTKSMKDVFESLEKIAEPTLHLVVPSYYLIQKSLSPTPRDSKAMEVFRANLRKYLDEKYWTSIKALHWIACFLDPSFKFLNFLPNTSNGDVRFRRDLIHDLDDWLLAEMETAARKLAGRLTDGSDR